MYVLLLISVFLFILIVNGIDIKNLEDYEQERQNYAEKMEEAEFCREIVKCSPERTKIEND